MQLRLIAAALTVLVVLFVGASFVMGDLGGAWDVFAGLATPWGADAWIAVPLSIIGYLAAPAVVGVLVAVLVERAVSRRLVTDEEAVKRARARIERRRVR